MADPRAPQSNLLEAARRDLTDLYRELGTGVEGLSQDDAEARLREFGPNELPSAKKPSVAEKVFVQARNLFNVLLIFAAALSFPTGSPQLGFAILAVVVFNITFNIVQEHRAEKVVEALHRLIPANAKVTRDGQVIALPVSQIVPGDVFALEEGEDRSLLEPFEDGVEHLAQDVEVKYDYLDIRVGWGVDRPADALRRAAADAGASTVVIGIAWNSYPRKLPTWIEELSAFRAILVRSPPREEMPVWPKKIMIPVLEEFHQEPFDLVAALTTSSVVPQVDVVAARVIQVPQIVPLYSTYRPDALVDESRELSLVRSIRNAASLRFMRPSIVMVREVGRDVVDFATERDVDTIILSGDWRLRRQGFLSKAEREIAARAQCPVLITLPPETSARSR